MAGRVFRELLNVSDPSKPTHPFWVRELTKSCSAERRTHHDDEDVWPHEPGPGSPWPSEHWRRGPPDPGDGRPPLRKMAAGAQGEVVVLESTVFYHVCVNFPCTKWPIEEDYLDPYSVKYIWKLQGLLYTRLRQAETLPQLTDHWRFRTAEVATRQVGGERTVCKDSRERSSDLRIRCWTDDAKD